MWIFIILSLTDIYIFWRLAGDLKYRSKTLRAVVFTVKAIQSLILLWFIVTMLSYKGEFADPANAYKYIVFGALAGLIFTVGSLYIVTGIGTALLGRILHRKLRGLVITNLIVSGALVLLFTDSYVRQRFDTRIVRQDIVVSNLDRRLAGMKIVLISDLHLSSWHGHYGKLDGVVSAINAEKPDLLINTGDFITYGWQEFGGCDTILRKAEAASGAFAIFGNHDDGSYYPGHTGTYDQQCLEKLSEKITASGYTLLSDTTVLTEYNGARIAISGIVTHGHHFNMRYGNFKKAFEMIPDSVFSLLLVHDPGAWDEAMQNDRMPQLTLSGHTHGMQAGLPFSGGRISPDSFLHKRWKGLYSNDDKYLYVTTGMGTIGMALRIFMPPEIVVITLNGK
jgi:predicted MPP superfamily phosphohydrolase